jgi:hypothetical protein
MALVGDYQYAIEAAHTYYSYWKNAAAISVCLFHDNHRDEYTHHIGTRQETGLCCPARCPRHASQLRPVERSRASRVFLLEKFHN